MYFVATATEQTGFVHRAETDYGSIHQALTSINWHGNASWIGPGPRVTRRREGENGLTYVAWVLDATDAIVAQYGGPTQAAAEIKRAVLAALQQLDASTWHQSDAQTYSPDVNGPLDWWRDGAHGASVTHTRDSPPEFWMNLASAAPLENPVGPDTALLRPQGPLDIVTGGTGNLADVGKNLKTAAYIVLAALGIYAVIRIAPPVVRWATRPKRS